MRGWIIGSLALGLSACAVGVEEADEQVENAGEEARQRCGGIAALPCPDGYECIISARCQGADCSGTCRKLPGGGTIKPDRCSYNDPNKTYVSKDPVQCMAMLFMCAAGTPFFDDCGCGCETTVSDCTPGCPSGLYCAVCRTIDGPANVCLPNGTVC
jgi:hypothetical protein